MNTMTYSLLVAMFFMAYLELGAARTQFEGWAKPAAKMQRRQTGGTNAANYFGNKVCWSGRWSNSFVQCLCPLGDICCKPICGTDCCPKTHPVCMDGGEFCCPTDISARICGIRGKYCCSSDEPCCGDTCACETKKATCCENSCCLKSTATCCGPDVGCIQCISAFDVVPCKKMSNEESSTPTSSTPTSKNHIASSAARCPVFPLITSILVYYSTTPSFVLGVSECPTPGFQGGYIFRTIRQDENCSIGIIARRPVGPVIVTMVQHIGCGDRVGHMSPYISFTSSLEIAEYWRGKTPETSRVVRVSLSDQVVKDHCVVTDLTNESNRNFILGREDWAKGVAADSCEVVLRCGNVHVPCTYV